MPRQLKEIVRIKKAIEGTGLEIVKRKRHYQIQDSAGKPLYTFPCTPSNPNWWKYALSTLRNQGHIT